MFGRIFNKGSIFSKILQLLLCYGLLHFDTFEGAFVENTSINFFFLNHLFCKNKVRINGVATEDIYSIIY